MGEALHHEAASTISRYCNPPSARFSFAALVAVLQYTSVIHVVTHNDLEVTHNDLVQCALEPYQPTLVP